MEGRKEGDGWMDWWVDALKENKIHGRVDAMRSQARQSYEGTGEDRQVHGQTDGRWTHVRTVQRKSVDGWVDGRTDRRQAGQTHIHMGWMRGQRRHMHGGWLGRQTSG